MWHLEGDVAVITIDNPPVNAGSHRVRQELLAATKEIAALQDLKGVVLIGAGDMFVAGSDLREFGAPLKDPQLPEVIAALERLPIPVVAAIRGAALGGGLELALGCDYRIAVADAILGLPEVSLGLIPGAGGTQRLPRAIGMGDALDLIVSSRRVRGEEAHRLGLVDGLAKEDLLAAAIKKVRGGVVKRPLSDLSVRDFDRAALEHHIARLLQKARNRPAAIKATELTLAASEDPFDVALAKERAAFQSIRVSQEAFAYRHVFFAERQAARGPKAEVPKLQRIGVVGLGTMGASIAYALALAGFEVVAIEAGDEQLRAGVDRFEGLIADGLKRARLTSAHADEVRRRFDGHCELSAAADCALVIEAVFEDIEIKRSVLKALVEIVPPSTLIGSNTSYLDLDALAGEITHPERFFGLHFFSPAHVMTLLEVVRADRTGDKAIATGMWLARKLGKQPVMARNGYGFIGNRIYAAYRRHAEYLLEDGASVAQIDQAMVDLGMAMGPFMVADLSGLDIAWRMRKAQSAMRKPNERYVSIPDRLCEMGRLGRKTGAGYYDYQTGKPQVAPEVEAIIAEQRCKSGVQTQSISAQDIHARCIGAMLNEAALAIKDGIAASPGDIDVAMIHGYGFPRWLGGPLWFSAHQPSGWVDNAIGQIAEAEGPSFRRGPVHDLLCAIRSQTPVKR